LPDRDIELEIGCGKGSFTVELAKRHPERLILAADVMLGRLRKLHKKRSRMELENMEILRVEAGMLVNVLMPPHSTARAHVLCPDPWPKDKHKGHRLLSSEFIGRLAQVLNDDGVFHFATDDVPYFNSASMVVERSGLFETSNLELIADIADVKSDFELMWESTGREVQHAAWRLKKAYSTG
jgi:tRNA (guanine-N7-)-methyltransferase